VRPPPTQVNSGNPRPHIPSIITGGPPSGPKASQASPITSGANGLAAPTGPASVTERNIRGRRERGGNQISSINTLLQQGGQQNALDRGHRGRGVARAGGQPETPVSTPATLVPPPPPPPPGRPEARDLGRDMVNSERVDLITGNAPANDDRDRERSSRRERSGRHSRRGSRSPDRTRDMKRGPPEEDRAPRSEHRDRRSDRGEGERERHQGRSPHRELIPGRDMGGPPRESGRDRERDRDSGRRDGRERDGARDAHDAGWPGERGERGLERGSGGRNRDARGEFRGDERRDGRGRDDSGRKRRSEEGMMDSRGQDKRPRRG
jgi:THO complex subunit 2